MPCWDLTFHEGRRSYLASQCRTVAASSLDSKLPKGRVHVVYVFVSLKKRSSNCGLRTSLLFRRDTGSFWGRSSTRSLRVLQEPPLPTPNKAALYWLICWGAQLKESLENSLRTAKLERVTCLGWKWLLLEWSWFTVGFLAPLSKRSLGPPTPSYFVVTSCPRTPSGAVCQPGVGMSPSISGSLSSRAGTGKGQSPGEPGLQAGRSLSLFWMCPSQLCSQLRTVWSVIIIAVIDLL